MGRTDAEDPWEVLMNATAQSAMACSMAYSKIAQQVQDNPNYLNQNAQRFANVLSVWAKRFTFVGPEAVMAAPLATIASLYNANVIAQVTEANWAIVLPALLAVLCKPALPNHCKSLMSAVFAMMRHQKPALLYPLSEMILGAIFQNNVDSLAGVVVILYPKQRKLVQQNIAMLISWQEGGAYCIDALNAVSLDCPDCMLPFTDRLMAFLTQVHNAICFQGANIILNLATRDPYRFVSYTNAVFDAYQNTIQPQFTSMKVTQMKILGLIGRTSKQKAEECMDLLHNCLQIENTDDVTAAILVEMKNIGGVFKSVLEAKRGDVTSMLSSPFEGVRANAANILNYLDNKDINSLPTAFAVQDAKIEAAHTAMSNLMLKNEQNSRDIARVNDVTVGQQIQLNSQQAQISDLERKVQELKSANDYIDSKMAEIKTFIAEFAKRLPVPAKFSCDGVLVKTICLDFYCSSHRDGQCLHPPGGQAFVTKTQEWGKWVKLSISACKLGLAAYNKDVIGALEGAYEIYEQLKDFEDPTFDKFCSQPFLTSAEQDNMINQLREAKFFDVFKYDAQTAKWMCCNCAKSVFAPVTSSASGTEALRPQHAFVRHHFHRFTWCCFCDEFIWGLGKQGYKCTKCKYRCHPQCLQYIPDNCGLVDIKCHLSGKSKKP